MGFYVSVRFGCASNSKLMHHMEIGSDRWTECATAPNANQFGAIIVNEVDGQNRAYAQDVRCRTLSDFSECQFVLDLPLAGQWYWGDIEIFARVNSHFH